MVAPGRREWRNTMNSLRLEDHELDAVSGGIWPLAIVAIAVAVILIEGSGTSNQQDHKGSRPNPHGFEPPEVTVAIGALTAVPSYHREQRPPCPRRRRLRSD